MSPVNYGCRCTGFRQGMRLAPGDTLYTWLLNLHLMGAGRFGYVEESDLSVEWPDRGRLSLPWVCCSKGQSNGTATISGYPSNSRLSRKFRGYFASSRPGKNSTP